MTQDQILLLSLFGAVFTLLLWGRLRYDMVAFGALFLAVILGLVPAGDAFSRVSDIRRSLSWRSCW